MTMLTRSGAVLLLAALAFSLSPRAEAATRSSRYASYWRNSSEGRVSTTTLERAVSRRGISSATQRAIDRLDDDPVDDLPVPVLLGVSLSSITPNFGDPRDGGERSHEGEDILAPKDDYVVSPTDAIVVQMGTGESAGRYVYTANPGGETFAYMHLDKFAEGLKVGAVLEPGDLIGYVGDTGNASGGPTHLHFEIRKSRKATDPYPRLAREFTLEERVDAVEAALKDADDPEEDAEMLAKNYRGVFVAARAAGLELPDEMVDALGATASSPAAFLRDLTLGSQGDDVIALQALIIAKDAGPAARSLASAGATGYFGALTQAALAEYQAALGIVPAAGYFGPLTRARVSLF